MTEPSAEQTREYEYLGVETVGEITTITLRRPPVNAFCQAMVSELHAAFIVADAAPGRVIVITGAGERAFSAGADLEEMLEMAEISARQALDVGIGLTRQIEKSRKTTIAAINGPALGGGMEIALACDLRVAAPGARLGLPEASVGIFPGWGGTVRLPRAIPPTIALEMILTGRAITGDEAAALGLVNVVADDCLAAAYDLAARVLRAAPVAQQQARRVVREATDMSLDSALAFESEAWMATFHTDDRREGHQAFLERRTPEWTGH